MTDAQRARLQAASDCVGKMLRLRCTPAEIIAALVRDHDAAITTRSDGNKLRVAGVGASCTWSADVGLLENWRKPATVRLMESA